MHLTDADYEDIVTVVVNHVLSNKSQPAVLMSMADSLDVLLDAAKSERWLRPYVGAERTSLAYERGKGLIRHHEFALAQAIMQKAADEDDEFRAMYLIEQSLKRKFLEFEGVPELTTYDRDDKGFVESRSIEYETACLWIEFDELTKAQNIMQQAADSGDIDCAIYLIEHTLLGRLHKLSKQVHYDPIEETKREEMEERREESRHGRCDNLDEPYYVDGVPVYGADDEDDAEILY